MARLDEVLRMFRAQETNDDAIPVLGDELAMRVLAAWQKTDQKWRAPRRRMPALLPTNQAAVWAWIVEGWTIDEDAVSVAAGTGPRDTHEKISMLQANRLIYPDGTIAKGARAAINVYIAGKLGIKQKQPKRREREDKRDDETN